MKAGGPLLAHKETIRQLMADGQTVKQVAERFGATPTQLHKFSARHNLGSWVDSRAIAHAEAHPIPDDFEAVWPTMSLLRLANHYGKGLSTIQCWARKRGLKRTDGDRSHFLVGGQASAPPPADFAEHVREQVSALCRRYGVGKGTIARWTATVGYQRPVYNGRPPQKPATLMRALGAIDVARNHRDMSRVGQAADFLRKYSGVWRCTETGRPDTGGKFWRRGSAVLTDDDLIERATRMGWDPDAWKRLAA